MCFNGDATWKGDSEGGLRFGSRTKRGFPERTNWNGRQGWVTHVTLHCLLLARLLG